MASPQKERGYVPIANDLYDHYIKFRMPVEVRMVCDFIIRKTYGWNKREDRIALSQFALALELKRPSVIRGLKKAISMNLISRRANRNGWIYRFNKDYDAWRQLAVGLIVSRRANASLAVGLHTKDNTTKDNNDVGTSPTEKMHLMRIHNDNDFEDQYEPKVDSDTQKEEQPQKKERKPQNKRAIKFQLKFIEKIYEKIGVRPLWSSAGYILNLKAQKHLTDEQLDLLLEDWLSTGKADEDLVQITQMLSTNNVNRWLARNQ